VALDLGCRSSNQVTGAICSAHHAVGGMNGVEIGSRQRSVPDPRIGWQLVNQEIDGRLHCSTLESGTIIPG